MSFIKRCARRLKHGPHFWTEWEFSSGGSSRKLHFCGGKGEDSWPKF